MVFHRRAFPALGGLLFLIQKVPFTAGAITELVDNDSRTCVSWLDVDELQYGEVWMRLCSRWRRVGRAVGVEILVLREDVLKTSKNSNNSYILLAYITSLVIEG